MLLGIGQVGRDLGHAFHLAQTLLEEVLCSGEFLTAFSGFLCCHEVGIGVGLRFNLLAVEQVKHLRQKQVEGATVDDEVMDVHHQIYPLLGGDNLRTVERSLPQVEGLDELPLVMGYVFLLALALGNLYRLLKVHNLDNFRPCTSKMRLQLRMRLDEGLHSLGQQLDVHIFGETNKDWRVIYSGFGVLDGIHINTHLSIRQRNVVHVGMCRLCFLLFCSASTHQCS